MSECVVVILAAGQGTRMRSELPKVLHKAAGRSLVGWVVAAAKEATDARPVVVYGNGGDAIPNALGPDCEYALQAERRGTGHAVRCAAEKIRQSGAEYTVVLAGDQPLVRSASIRRLIEGAKGKDVCLLTGQVSDATGYGRILRDEKDQVCRIVEHKDATEEQKAIGEINLSYYCFRTSALLEALSKLTPNNAQGEYYLTDCVQSIYEAGGKTAGVPIEDMEECEGVNDRVQLARVTKLLYRRKAREVMLAGATLIDPKAVYLDPEVEVEQDAVIYPGVVLEGKTHIGKGTVLYPGSRIADSRIGENTTVQNSVILQSKVGSNTQVGPYAYLRPGTEVGDRCRVGDFVECKNAQIMDGAKVSHLSYIGDGQIGKESNIGCGVVFVNYDGKTKSRTVVGERCFIGCNTNLVAPVSVGDGAYIAAGATVTKDIPEDSLCIARAREVVKEGWGKGRFPKKEK